MTQKKKPNRVIYRLWHNLSKKGRIGYIGKDSYYPSRQNLSQRKRHKGHPKLYSALNKYPISVWRKEILARGFRSEATLNKAEIYWIKKFDSKNKGYNCTDGGEGALGAIRSAKTKAKLRKIHLGKKLSAETRAKISKASRNMSAETREKLRRAMLGRTFSKADRLKMSLAQTGNKKALGHKHSPESIVKMRKAAMGNKRCLGRKLSAETKAKIGLGNKGKKVSYESKKKMSRARKRWWRKHRKA